MRLAQVEISNFRSCRKTKVNLDPHLTLLVGENDAGKSNVIDALRLATPPATGRRSIYLEPERDLSYGLSEGEPISLTTRFDELTPVEEAIYAPLLAADSDELVRSIQFSTAASARSRPTLLVGDVAIVDPEPETRSRVSHVYLPPLRDATRLMSSQSGLRLGDMIRVLSEQDDVDSFVAEANAALRALAGHEVPKKVVDGVEEHLTALTHPVRKRVMRLSHEDQPLHRLVAALRMQMAADGVVAADLSASGHGYANVLYIATVALELTLASEFDLTLLLVEEPEAHLHPQLQTVLLAYLDDLARLSAEEPESGVRAGRIQVVATSHSSVLASAISSKSIVVIRPANIAGLGQAADPAQSHANDTPSNEVEGSDNNASTALSAETEVQSPDDTERQAEGEGVIPAGAEHPLQRSQTEAVFLGDEAIGLTDRQRRKIDRYLDVTKSELLFAKTVVLVEGISEALILRALAEHSIFPSSKDADGEAGVRNRRAREEFRAASVIPIDGVDFIPYLKLLAGARLPLADRIVVVTDGDNGAGDGRRDAINSEFAEFVASGLLQVFVCDTTLEGELFAPLTNQPILERAFIDQHPRSQEKWDAMVAEAGQEDLVLRAKTLHRALNKRTLEIGKGDFAQLIANSIEFPEEGDSDFEVPQYLSEVVRSAIVEQPLEVTEDAASGSD